MPLPSSVRLTDHFTAFELGADRPEATDAIVANLRTVAAYLETVRAILGVPLVVNTPTHRNRGFRPLDANAAVGGSTTSDHPHGLAADVVPQGKRLRASYDALTAARSAGRLPAFDQIIYYPLQGHIHVGLGSRLRGEVRIYLAEGQYPFLTSELIQRLGGAVASAAVLAVTTPAVGLTFASFLFIAIVAIFILSRDA